MTETLGILGGMGPAATADFLRKIVERTQAQRDQDHIPIVVCSVPQVPDRSAAILDGGPSPLPAMLRGVRTLEAAGAAAIAIACNTAHYWIDDLQRATAVPILHIADAVVRELDAIDPRPHGVGLVATRGTLHAGFYQRRLGAAGHRCLASTPEELDELVMPGIGLVKGGRIDEGARLLHTAVRQLADRGAQAVVLACTEVPVALDRLAPESLPACVDASLALADACVRWWQARLRR